MLSTDQNIFNTGSEVQKRMIEYGSLAEELHIIVYADAKNTNKMRMMRISENVFVYPTNTRFKLFYFWDAYKIGKTIIRNWKLKIRNSRDKILVTSQDPFETGLVGYLLKRKFSAGGGSASGGGLPLQVQIHTDFLSPYFRRESLKNKIRVLLAKWLVKKVLRQDSGQADCIRAASERIKTSLLTLYSKPHILDPIVVLPIFVDVEKIKNAPIKTDLHKKYPGYDFIILMASRLTKEKNIPMAIEAFASVKRQVSSVKNPLLLIIGDGPEKNNLKLLTTRYSLHANIIFEPWTDDLISYYKTANLFLLTSNYEGYGRTIIEALAAGCPVLTTDVGIASEVIEFGKSGMIIKPRDTKALIGGILGIIRSWQNYRGRIGDGVIKDKNEYLSQYKKTFSFCAFRKK